jgi:arsenate reductase (thioredoxin)
MDKVIFACVHNAGRSQIAAAFFNQLADRTRAEAVSAGTQPARQVHPIVVEVMKEVGLDLSRQTPQLLTDALARDASLLVTMGCGDACPYVPRLTTLDWPLQDPEDQPIESVRRIRDEVRERVTTLVHARNWSRT